MFHPKLVGLREERGGHESRNHVVACQVQGDFVFSMSRGALRWMQGWARGTRGVHCLVAAATRGAAAMGGREAKVTRVGSIATSSKSLW